MTCTYVVGRYRPAGNMGGQYQTNVPKGSFTKSVCSSLDKLVKEIEDSAAGSAAPNVKKPPSGSSKLTAGAAGGSKGGTEADSNRGAGSLGSDSGGTGFQQAGLLAHNKFRKIHGTSSIKLNTKMCSEAEEYAKVLARKGSLQHARVKDGENLAYGCTSGPGKGLSGSEATKNWYLFYVLITDTFILFTTCFQSIYTRRNGSVYANHIAFFTKSVL